MKAISRWKLYNRAVRVYKYIYEALMRLVWAEFIQLVDTNHPEKNADIRSFLEQVNHMVDDMGLLQSPLLAELMIMWKDFLEHLRHNNEDDF